jgi:hypothetical protein
MVISGAVGDEDRLNLFPAPGRKCKILEIRSGVIRNQVGRASSTFSTPQLGKIFRPRILQYATSFGNSTMPNSFALAAFFNRKIKSNPL